jgi:hypothetical protein
LKKNIEVISDMTFKQDNLISQMNDLGLKQKDVNNMIQKSLNEQQNLVNTQTELLKLQLNNGNELKIIEDLTSKTKIKMDINLKNQKKIQDDQEKLKELQKQGLISMIDLKDLTSSAADKSKEIMSKQEKMVRYQNMVDNNLKKLKDSQLEQFKLANDSIHRLIQFSVDQNQKIIEGNKEMGLMKSNLDGFALSFQNSVNGVLINIKSKLDGIFGELGSNGEKVKVLHHDMIGYFESFRKSCKIFHF